MPNAILTPTAVTREALRILHQKANFLGSINRQYDDSFAKSGAKIGDSLKIRVPNEYVVRSGATLTTQDTVESSVTLQVATQKGVDITFSSAELTLSLDDFSKRILDPAVSVLVANVEADVMNVYKEVYNAVWNGGSNLTYDKFLDGRVYMQNRLAPIPNRTANMNPQDMVNLVKDTKTLFNDQGQLSKQYKDGYMGRAAGFDFMENTLWPVHTRGDASAYVCNTSTGITNGSATITLSGGTGTIKAGDQFTIGGVYAVHPETKQQLALQVFVATADGTTSVTVAPVPYTTASTGKQNVTIVGAGASKPVTISGTASTAVNMSMAYHEDAFTFATADLEMPKGVDFSAREVLDGVSLRVVRQYAISTDTFPCRLDILYGYKTLRGGHAVRYHNN